MSIAESEIVREAPSPGRWLKRLALPFLIASGLTATGFGIHFFIDDFYFVAILDGLHSPGTPWELYTFAPGSKEKLAPFIEQGPYPWWTLPDLKVRFCRPLSSGLMQLDHYLFGHDAVWWQVHSLLWYLLLVAAWVALAYRILPKETALLAVLIYVIDPSHWMPAVWIANRNALVANVGPLFGVWAHIKWREDGWKPGLPLSFAGYLLGMFGSEAWFCVLAYTGTYELFGRNDSLVKRTLSVMPAALLAGVYLLAYRALGYGVHGSGMYLDPTTNLFQYLANAVGRFFALIGGYVFLIQLDTWAFIPPIRIWLVLFGVAAAAMMVWMLRIAWKHFDERERLALRWLIPGGLLSLTPVLAAFPMNRLLLIPSLTGSVVVASLLRYWWRTRRITPRRAFGIACGTLAVLHLIVSPLMWPLFSGLSTVANNHLKKTYLAMPIDDAKASSLRVFVITVDNPLMSMYPAVTRTIYGKPQLAGWHALSVDRAEHVFTRTGANSFTLESVNGALTNSSFLEILRSPDFRFTVGETVKLDQGMITVKALKDGKPSIIEVQLANPLDDSNYLFLQAANGDLAPFKMPAVGERVVLPATTLRQLLHVF